jgi:hypothetical protein
MKKDEVLGIISMEESDFRSLKRIESGYDTIRLLNNKGQEVDVNTIAEYFRQVEGIEKVRSLIISTSSNQKDLMIVKGFPNLLNIDVHGERIESLDGLEHFCNGRYLYIETGKNHSRSIANISQAPITMLSLIYARKGDFDAISASTTIKNLELGYCPHPPFDQWVGVPLEYIKFSGAKFKELGDTALLKQLKEMLLISCRKLERFVGDNSGITWMTIASCTHLDLNTIKTFRNIETLVINTNPNEVSLSAFGGLEKLKDLSLLRCKVNVDIINLKEAMPSLEKLYISNLKKDQVLELTRLNPGLRFEF